MTVYRTRIQFFLFVSLNRGNPQNKSIFQCYKFQKKMMECTVVSVKNNQWQTCAIKYVPILSFWLFEKCSTYSIRQLDRYTLVKHENTMPTKLTASVITRAHTQMIRLLWDVQDAQSKELLSTPQRLQRPWEAPENLRKFFPQRVSCTAAGYRSVY